MKKVALISIILIAIMSCAFSLTISETQILTIKSKVGCLEPAFQFEFTSGMLNEPTAVLVTNADAEVISNSNYNEFASDDAAIEVADISRYNLNLLFTAKLANNAKSNEAYTLKFTAGGFNVTRNGEEGKLNPSSELVTVSNSLASLAGVDTDRSVSDNSENAVQFKFNGTECNEGDLASFHVGYTADKTIDPMKAGYYYTDISLEISSDF